MQKSKFSILSGTRAGAVLAGALSANLFCVGGAFADPIGVVDEEAKNLHDHLGFRNQLRNHGRRRSCRTRVRHRQEGFGHGRIGKRAREFRR